MGDLQLNVRLRQNVLFAIMLRIDDYHSKIAIHDQLTEDGYYKTLTREQRHDVDVHFENLRAE